MSKSGFFTPKTQEALGRTLEATRGAMAEVHENVRILEEARKRADKRIDSLKEELAQAKSALAEAVAANKTLRQEQEQGAAETAEMSAKLAGAIQEVTKLEAKVEELGGERDVLVQKARGFEQALSDKADIEVQLAQAAEANEALEGMVSELKKKLKESRTEAKDSGQALEDAKASVADRDRQLAEALRAHEELKAELDGQIAQQTEALTKTQDELDRSRGTAFTISRS